MYAFIHQISLRKLPISAAGSIGIARIHEMESQLVLFIKLRLYMFYKIF